MAASGSFNTGNYEGRYLVFSWTEKSQNIAANTTTISWTLKGAGDAPAGWYYAQNIKVTINGATVYNFPKSSGQIQLANGTTVASGTYTFTHKTDGSQQFTAYAEAGIYAWAVNCTGSKTFTLDTIPRASTPTVSSSSVNMGSAVTINTNRASSSFTHDLSYSFAGGSYVSIATGVGASYSWTTPDLASKIPNATSGTVTIKCVTKSGSTTVGNKSVTMTLKVPTTSAFQPSISSVTTTEATSGLAAQFGAFIKSKSKVKATISAAGAKGSTIKSYKTTLNGKTYTGSSWTSSVLTSSGTLSLVTTVTDSRGRTAKKTTDITVLNYAAPVINDLQVYRVNAAGGSDQDGIYIAVRYKYSVTSLNSKNTASMVVDYKRSTDTSWTNLLTGSARSADTTAKPTSPTFSTDYQYDVRLTLTDWFGSSSAYIAQLPSGAVILDILANGNGISFGATASRSGVYFGWPVKGQVFGLGEATAQIPEGADLNDYTQPGIYAVTRNTTAETLRNCPSAYAGTLRVYNAIGSGAQSGEYVYLLQEYRTYRAAEPTYRRDLMTGGDGSWSAGVWNET